jgi:Ca2+-dependent lipid-binding protein
VKRFRTRGRDDVQRELVKIRLTTETETADWLNNFLGRFWLLYEPVLSKSIIATVDQVLSTNTPTFLDSMRLAEFTLGNKAPRIESVRTFPNTDDDVVIMDWVITFTPNDVSNITPKQVAKKTNPKIVLSIRVGKGLATAALPVLVEDITFEGRMKFQLKLMSNFPHVQIVDFQFVERPKIDFALKPIGGETFGFDIANVGRYGCDQAQLTFPFRFLGYLLSFMK